MIEQFRTWSAAAFCAAVLIPQIVQADVTGDAGSSQPHSNMQPSLAINYLISLQGTFPSIDSSDSPAQSPLTGELIMSASSVVPKGYAECNGQLLSINQNIALYALLGIAYGGDGKTTFALPNLQGRTAIDAGQGPGISNYALGQQSGAPTSVLTTAQMPAHTHTLPSGGTTSPTGGGVAMSILQPSLAVNYFYDPTGVYPTQSGGSGDSFLGQVRLTAGIYPSGYNTNGQLLSIQQNDALFNLYGTTYGGDGQNTFAVPDLRGRAPLGIGNGQSSQSLGEVSGAEQITLNANQIPSHDHSIPPADGGGNTGFTGGGQPYRNIAPSLGLNYIIALQGIFPVDGAGGGPDTGTPMMGQISLFGGNFAPNGYAMCQGQLLPINQNQALFSLLGTKYGGNGTTTFALPDLRDRAAIDIGTDGFGNTYSLGQVLGSENASLTAAQLPVHDHDFVAAPEPGSLALVAGAMLLLPRRRALQ